MAQRNRFSVVSLALFVAIATPSALMTVFTAEPSRLLAQTSEPSPVPTPFAVPEGSVVRIDGSESLEVVNEELQQRYEESFAGTEVTLQTNGTPDAMQALRDGDIDIATIGRPLTNAEAEEGFQAIALPREKIA
ncbi:MAG: substrate-binding domain-containing protein, partial [Cyanobacteria bacterium J06638_20]